jgi:hypothetical protein
MLFGTAKDLELSGECGHKEDYVCIILISFPHIYLTYKITKLDIHVFITRPSYLTFTLTNTTGTRCEAEEKNTDKQ